MLITSAVGILVGGLFQEKLRVHQEADSKTLMKNKHTFIGLKSLEYGKGKNRTTKVHPDEN